MIRKPTGDHEHKHTTNFTHTANCDAGSLMSKVTLASKEVSYAGCFKPDALNKDGVTAHFEGEIKHTPSKKETYTDFWVKCGGFDCGSLKPSFDLCAHSTLTDTKRENGGFFAMNWAYEKDINAGFHVEMGNDNKVKRADGTFHFRNTGAGDFYLRGDVIGKHFAAGHHDKCGDLTHVIQAEYDAGSNAKKAFMDTPLTVRAGFKYPLGKTTYTTDWLIGKSFQWNDKVSMPVTDNITVNSFLKYDLANMFMKPSEAGHKWGVGIEMKL